MATRRSMTGCAACKRKRRKCDEGKPRCQRCVSSGEPCSYEYVQPPNAKSHLIPRTKPAPRPPSELLAVASQNTSSHSELAATSLSVPCISAGSTPSTELGILAPQSETSTPNPNHINTLNSTSNINPSPIPGSSLHRTRLSHITPGLTQPELGTVQGATSQGSGIEVSHERLRGLNNGESEIAEEHDLEGIQALLCAVPNMDRNAKENTLPFVLQCYAQWAIVAVFEPLKIVHVLREEVFEQFSSENTRTRTILMANVMSMFAKNLSVNDTGMCIISHLASEVQAKVQSFLATPYLPASEADRQDAIHVLDNTLEIMTLQVDTRSLAACIQSVEAAAPVFRRACLELPDQPLNLADILLEPGLNLRHFVSGDILSSLTSGRPTYFKYEVAFSADLCERMFQVEENYGLQCLHGLPDQFILMFAWINSLCELPGASTDQQLVTWVETEVLRAKLVMDQSDDPALRIGRTVVREGWRNAVLIYLYMVLCKADANDSRVVRVLKNFMRLIKGIKPGRNPDTYLVAPMAIAGVAACKERDRSTIRHRILNVPECSTPGTVGNDIALELEDVWATTRSEGRAAVWADLGIACSKVTGIK